MKEEISFPSPSDIEKTNKIAEDLFGTEKDETQAKPTLENALKLISIEKNNFICLKNGDGIITRINGTFLGRKNKRKRVI